MNKKIRLYQWISYFVIMFLSGSIGIFFILKSHEYSRLYLEWFITPFAIGIILFILGIILFFNNLRCIHNHLSSFHYLQNEVMPQLLISHEDHQKAIDLFEKYMLKAYIINSLFKILIISIGFLAIFIIDLAVYIYDSNLLLIIDIILAYFFIFIILVITNLILTKCYKTYVISTLDNDSYVFIDFSYIYLCHNYASLPCPFSYKMNIATGLSRLGEYEKANIYLKQLWSEEKRLTKKKMFQLTYNYNCYIFSLRLHLDNSNQYKDEVNQLLTSHPRLCQSKSTQLIPKRIQIEEAFLHKSWNDVIQYIHEFNHLDVCDGSQVYYHYLLYVAYLHTHNQQKADDIYNQYKDHIHFQKLIELESKTIN